MKKNVIIEFEASKGSAIPTNAEIDIELVELPDFVELADGVYLVTITDGVASWTLNPLPALPTADGNYQLTVTSGVLSWTEIV